MYDYAHEVEFETYNENDVQVRVHISFNIDQDDIEVLEFSRLVFKKCYSIELGHITATILGTDNAYNPTDNDLLEWKRDIESALKKEFNRQTA